MPFRSAAFVLLVLLVPVCIADQDRPIRSADIPREFKGEYRWRNAAAKPQTLQLWIDRVEEKNGTIRFFGIHVYMPGDCTMRVEGKIDPRTRRVYMRESEPSCPDDADVDGAFVGTITPNLQTIEATWTNASNGQQGDLRVQAQKVR
jgi:hypothetical protein